MRHLTIFLFFTLAWATPAAALIDIPGKGPLFPETGPQLGLPTFTAVGPIDATGEKIAVVGRVWFPARTGSKNVTRVGFRFGTVDKTGGSALTVSLQDVVAGPPLQPDETADQTVAIATGNASFDSNTWIRTDTFSAARSVAYGSYLAVVIEFDGGGRQGTDVVNLSGLGHGGLSSGVFGDSAMLLKTAAWAVVVVVPNIVLEFDDGTFGTLDGAFATSAVTAPSYNLNTGTADEYALSFSLPFDCKIDALWVWVAASTATSDFEVILYSGTTALATATVEGDVVSIAAARRYLLPIAPQSLSANTVYKVAVRPTTTSNLQAYHFDVADVNHLTLHDGGTAINFDTRLDQGAWAGATTTRRLFGGVRISALGDSAPAGGPIVF